MNHDTKKLQCRNIFIDTQAFTQHNFIFEGTALKRLAELGEAGLISVILTDVVSNEVLKKMKERLAKLHSHQKKHFNETLFIHNELEEPPKLLDEPQMLAAAKSAWEKYLERSQAKIISCDSVSVSEVIIRYFECTPPFSDGKKYEFPDAISLLCLEKWTNQNETSLYVVSGDPDLAEFCASSTSLIPIKSISEFLDIYNRTEQELTNKVHQLVDKNVEEITKQIREAFGDGDLEWDLDAQWEECEFWVNQIEIEQIDVIEVDRESAFISAKTGISCLGSAKVYDLDHYPDQYIVNLQSDDVYDVTMRIELSESLQSIIAIEDIVFDGGRTIRLSSKL